MEPKTEVIAAQPSWVVENGQVRVAITHKGGHMAPVRFFNDTGEAVLPYHVSPWQGEGIAVDRPVLEPLRGDFFCLPFGGDCTVKGVAHTTHGEPATQTWTLRGLEQEGPVTRLTLAMATTKIAGRITKHVQLVDGHNVVYVSDVLEGYDARTSLGHHATLAGGERPDALLLSTSPLLFGMVSPRPPATFTDGGEYNALAAGATFRSLDRVPTVWKEMPWDSCASFPRRRGFCDIIQVYNKPSFGPAWTAAVNAAEGWLWFAIKDPAVLPSTVFWMENHGRHGSPWNGRNCCIGLEDVCAWFAAGLAASLRRNELNQKGIATAHRLSPARPLPVNYIEGVVRVPRGFGRATSAVFDEGLVCFVGESGKKVKAAVRHEFVSTGKLD